MTAFDRFDPFERRISGAIDEIAAARLPDYLDDVLQLTARTPQRPRWTFLERWLPMDLATRRLMVFGRLPARPLVLILLILAIVGGAIAVYVGTQRRLPPAFGPAGNGQLVFGMNGDLYAVDALTSQPRLLVGGKGEQGGALNSPDGQLVAYDNYDRGVDRVWVANADGSNPRQVLDAPFTGGGASWSPDSTSLALVTNAGGGDHQMWLASADGSGARELDLGKLEPWDVVWDPQQSGVMLIRAEDGMGGPVDLYFVNTSGRVLSKLDMTGGRNLNGAEYEYSGIAFSPDGETIAYNVVEAEEPPLNRFRVHVMNRDGSNDRRVPAPLQTRFSQAWSVFSPDGKWIAMESWETGADDTAETRIGRLAVAPADGSAPARWLGPSEVGQPLVKSWAPDGTYILIAFPQLSEAYAVDPETGDAEKLPWLIDLPDVQRISR